MKSQDEYRARWGQALDLLEHLQLCRGDKYIWLVPVMYGTGFELRYVAQLIDASHSQQRGPCQTRQVTAVVLIISVSCRRAQQLLKRQSMIFWQHT